MNKNLENCCFEYTSNYIQVTKMSVFAGMCCQRSARCSIDLAGQAIVHCVHGEP